MNEYAAACPTCHTSFKVTLDLLRVADGWAACGQCQHVFDAQVVLKMIAPDHALRFLPNSVSMHSDVAVPRLTAAIHIVGPEQREQASPNAEPIDAPNSEVAEAKAESNLEAMPELETDTTLSTTPQANGDTNTRDDNVHIHINNAVPASEQTAKHLFSSGHGILSEQNAWEQRSRARRKTWYIVSMLLLIGMGSIAALSRPISAAWPASVETFQTLGLPTAAE